MALTSPYIKLTWGGSLASNNDIWSVGIHLAAKNVDVSDTEYWNAIKSNITNFATAISAFHTRTTTRIPGDVKLEWVKLALIGLDDRYSTAPAEHIYPAPVSGGVTTAGYVPQVATVVTLVSSKYKDPGKYNRFYLPTAEPTASQAWSLTTEEANGISGSAVTLLEAINAPFVYDNGSGDITYAAAPIVLSKTTGSNLVPVTVRVGTVYDTQRRRRNSLPETYMDNGVTIDPLL